jgi:hypothetical protein
MTRRLTTITKTIAPTPFAASRSPLAPLALSGPSSGNSAMSGMTARSWNSRIANARRPLGLLSSPRSPSQARTIAVDDMARPNPMTIAACQESPSATMIAVITIPVSSTCAPPNPKTGWRNAHNREGSSSSPTRNSSSTTPSSAMVSVASGSAMRPIPHGPMIAPRGQIAEHRAQLHAPEQRNHDHRGAEKDRGLFQEGHRIHGLRHTLASHGCCSRGSPAGR